MRAKLAIIDYGMGNLYSVRNAFTSLGIGADVIAGPDKIASYDKLILPGVGAFGDAMDGLKKRSFVTSIKSFIASGKPFLGICLGMQLLLESSEESKKVKGLAIIPGVVKRFSSTIKCPHMGWNKIEKPYPKLALFRGLGKDIYAYFCHSYFVKPQDKKVVAGVTDYGIKFASILRYNNVYGMQFHPEKSQKIGLALLKNFIRLC